MKSKIFRQIVCIFMALTLVLSLCGCGEKTNPTKGNSSGKTDGNTATQNTYFDPGNIGANGEDYTDYDPYKDIAKYKDTTVKFATWINHMETEGADPIKSFEEKFGINVELVYCPQDNYIESVLALIASNNSPDVYVDNPMWPLTLQIAQPFSVTGIDLNEPIWDQANIRATSIGDTVYGVNTVNSVWGGSYCCLFNRDLLETNGIKTPYEYIEEGNWTWDSLREIAVQVDNLGEDYYGCSLGEVMAYPSCFGASSTKYDYKTGTFTNTITSSGVVEAMRFMANLHKEGLAVSQNLFTNGKVGWVIRDTYAIKTTGYYKAMDPLDLGVVSVPTPKKDDGNLTGSWLRNYGIVKGSKNPVAAGMFIRYFLDPANYNMDNTFINEEAAEYYWESRKARYEFAKTKDITFENLGVAETIGSNVWLWYRGAYEKDPAQVVTNLASVSNIVDTAVQKSNELIKTYR